ncbi:hypothetical protein VPNG_02193 [Cytospora leucostoma]|uniref:BZIP domain-containing protein n=1 Tax=Cytospora leucostoma TaxID=1230097 RepID=A0A423XHH6_9PEZI|nr:hypothetical protein VPNG_02193 [Cytospora leucostoma]
MPQRAHQQQTGQNIYMGSAEPNPAGIDYSHVEDNGSTSFNKTTNKKMEQGAIATTNSFSYDVNKAMYGPSYPHYSGFFDYNEAGTTPTDSLLLPSGDVQFAIPTAPGDNSWSHRHAWDPDNTTGLAFDTNMPPSSSMIHHTPAPFVWGGMSNFEPMVATTWPMASGEPTSAAAPESPMSARNSSQQSTTERSSSSSRSRRPSVARMHSSTASTVAHSPASTTADTFQQREQARFENRHNNKRRMSGLEPPQQQQKPQGLINKGKRPAVVTATPLAPSIRPTSSPMEDHSTIFVAEDTYRHTNLPNHPDISRQANPSSLQLQEHPPPQPLPPSMNGHDEYAMGQPPTLPPPQQQQHQQHASQALRERNRAAANKCRRKSKAVVADLEATERELSDEHEQLSQTARGLREEVLALKNALLVHGHCEDEVIQQYLANSARLVGNGGEAGQGMRGHHGFM